MDSPAFVVLIIGKKNDEIVFYGTGFAINSKGDIATCHHVVAESDEDVQLYVEVPYTQLRPYKVRCTSKSNDLAIIEGFVPANPDMPFANLNCKPLDSNTNKTVCAFGFSAKEHYKGSQRYDATITAYSSHTGRIGLNCTINSGDSGGPVLANDHTVIGILWAKDTKRIGHAMAIPVARLIELISENQIDVPCLNQNIQTESVEEINEESSRWWVFGLFILIVCLFGSYFARNKLSDLQGPYDPPILYTTFPISTSTYLTYQGYDTRTEFNWSKMSGLTSEQRETVTKYIHKLWPCNAIDLLNKRDNPKISLGADGNIRPVYCAVRFRSSNYLRIPKGKNIKIKNIELISSNLNLKDSKFKLEVYEKQLDTHILGSNPFGSYLYLDFPELALNTLIDKFDENDIPVQEITFDLSKNTNNLELVGSSDNDRFVYLTSKGKHTVTKALQQAQKISDLNTTPQNKKVLGIFYEVTPTEKMWTGSIKLSYEEDVLVLREDPNNPPENIPSVKNFNVHLINEQDRNATEFQSTNLEIENQTNRMLTLVLTYIPNNSTAYAHRFYDIHPKTKTQNRENNFGGPYHISVYSDGKWYPLRKWYDLGITSTRKVIIDDASGAFRCSLKFEGE